MLSRWWGLVVGDSALVCSCTLVGHCVVTSSLTRRTLLIVSPRISCRLVPPGGNYPVAALYGVRRSVCAISCSGLCSTRGARHTDPRLAQRRAGNSRTYTCSRCTRSLGDQRQMQAFKRLQARRCRCKNVPDESPMNPTTMKHLQTSGDCASSGPRPKRTHWYMVHI